MGISGLLPLLKDIQVNRPLSHFAGQTLAVDAYVWLHKGTYGCAPDLASGKKTTKYVDYAMHRVRLLQHYRIQPYIVFDGGPLPAKKGTESDRKKKRAENLARANALAAQGKHSQAREFYVKCVDVTPQMAFQLIKALRAEGVPYVVAPYEADAQLAYLERSGLVDGVITEDSDLLVFGCRTVLFKMDAVAATITCIARDDFARVAAGAVSLVGWSDVQFRQMAILSGCDYLPSIPGVGLKTAWALLRKYRTVENVIRALRLEGKKRVPMGYLEAFQQAEKVFLHQRVYDPVQEILVHLIDPPDDAELDEATEAYVGAKLAPALAKQIAEGDACPISHSPMEDINPTFAPRALKAIPMNRLTLDCPGKERGKGTRKVPEKPAAGLLGFLSAKAPPQSTTAPRGAAPAPHAAVGRASGKRTLAEAMDRDTAAKRKRHEGATRGGAQPAEFAPSKYFCAAAPGSKDRTRQVSPRAAGPPCAAANRGGSGSRREDKENVPCAGAADTRGAAQAPDAVAQEDGYASPSPSRALAGWDTPEVSSPAKPGSPARWDGADDSGADGLSSPPAARRRAERAARAGMGRVLVRGTPPPPPRGGGLGERGPDLRDTLGEWDWDEVTSGSECPEADEPDAPSASASPGPVTPADADADADGHGAGVRAGDAGDDEDAAAARHARVASGWWERWARTGKAARGGQWKQTALRRRETTMTADGRQRAQTRTRSARAGSKGEEVDLRSAGRRSLVFAGDVKAACAGDSRAARAGEDDGAGGPGIGSGRRGVDDGSVRRCEI